MPNTNEQKCLTRLLTSKDDAREQETSKKVSLETMRDNGAKTDQEKILIKKQHKGKKTFITFRNFMTRSEKCVIQRGKIWTTLWDYCTEVHRDTEAHTDKLYYVLYVNNKQISSSENKMSEEELAKELYKNVNR